MSAAQRSERSRDELAVTMSGLYPSLVEWSQRVGEGRVSVVRSILAAERSARKVHGVIVFDAGTRIRWDRTPGPARPGYGGAGGMFSELLGVPDLVPMAALSSEIYLPHDPDAPLSGAIAEYIRRRIVVDEQGDALLAMLTQGTELEPGQVSALQSAVARLLATAVAPDAPPGSVTRLVVMPLRRVVRENFRGELRARLMTRLSPRQYHLRQWSKTFKAYREIAFRFERAQVAELQRADGSVHSVAVMRMPSGDQKQLTYDLTARIVDSDELPVNTIIVSTWARTGWNVIRPNVLIDATATRDVTAWQQLRGRSMRAMRTWTNDCYGPGEGHAPMVYAGDPRQDVPSALRKHLTETLRDRDATIVKGWLEGIAQGGAEDLGLD